MVPSDGLRPNDSNALTGERSRPLSSASSPARPAWLFHVAAIVLALLPLLYCILRGAVGASLWLDEILYYHFERHPEIRAIEMGRPGSFWPRLVGNFAYCDLQRAVHAAFRLFGFDLSANPELYLRLPSIAYFVLAVIASYVLSVRIVGDRLWAAGVALAFASTPAFLFYAFEARVYSLAALLIILFVGVMFPVLEGAKGWIVVLGALLGLMTPWAHLWNVCLLAAIGLCLPWIVWRDPEHWRKGVRVALVIGFGLGLVAVQALYVFLARLPGQHSIPLFEPQPWKTIFWKTIHGPFLGLLRGNPEYVLAILLTIALFRMRGKMARCLPAAVWISVALSVALMARFGLGISPRHQTALYAGIFACLALTKPEIVSKALLANLIVLNLVLLPSTMERIQDKGNAKQIAGVIGSGERLRRMPVVVQHSFDLGYPDPLHSFVLAFYLDGVDPSQAVTPILELPTHRDVRNVLLDRDYFLNGAQRLDFFASAPTDAWRTFLRNLPEDRLWLVSPASELCVRQERQYESALNDAGFTKVPAIGREFNGYPTTKLMFWKRSNRRR